MGCKIFPQKTIKTHLTLTGDVQANSIARKVRLVALQKITQSHPSAVQPALEINVCVCVSPPSWVKCSPLESQEHSAYQWRTVANRVEGGVF